MSSETIYLLRHGQTEWNRKGILQGQLDSQLTEKGRRQVQVIGDYLAHTLTNKDDIHMECSHLGRARATAEILRQTLGLGKSQLSSTELLAELHLGEWQGMDKASIESRWPGSQAQRERDKWHFQIPGGENYDLLAQRAHAWLTQQRSAAITIVITHQQCSNVLRGLYGKLTPAEILRLVHEQHCFFQMRNGDIERHCTQAEASCCDY